MTETSMDAKAKGMIEIECVIRDKDGNIKDREVMKVKLDGTAND